MPTYELSPESLADLENTWDFIAVDNPGAADCVIDELFEAFERLRFALT
jgi:plasmid stabilization system protein ParE